MHSASDQYSGGTAQVLHSEIARVPNQGRRSAGKNIETVRALLFIKKAQHDRRVRTAVCRPDRRSYGGPFAVRRIVAGIRLLSFWQREGVRHRACRGSRTGVSEQNACTADNVAGRRKRERQPGYLQRHVSVHIRPVHPPALPVAQRLRTVLEERSEV